ncbi:T9SS type A sorting domain-containing protein [Rubrivirga sp. IMCC43871]|uniref:T9SS type A sorting domain-containing protein n=1 Tax=Rubrivirga sp. IMCC43871 TaxID=3391575 RepID=UPI0039902601
MTRGGTLIIWNGIRRFNTFWSNRVAGSNDGGLTWDARIDPGGPSDLFAASVEGGFVVSVSGDAMNTRYGVTRSVDDGRTWGAVTDPDGGLLDVGRVSAIAARGDHAALFDEVLFFEGCPDGPYSPCAGVARSDDRGETWTASLAAGAYPGANPNPNRLALGPDGSLYGWTEGYDPAEDYRDVYRLPPSDSVWVPVSLPFPTAFVRALDVADDGAIYVGTQDGVYVSKDLGGTWTADGLRGSVRTLDRTESGTLLALADQAVWRRTGDGAWDRGQVPVGTDGSGPPAATLQITAWPNPTADRVVVETIGTQGGVALEVLDVVGRTVSQGSLDSIAGRARFDIEVGSWSPGVYVIRATDARSSAVSRITVAR